MISCKSSLLLPPLHPYTFKPLYLILMSAQNQLFLKLFVLYLVLFGVLTTAFDYLMGFDFDLRKSAPLFILVAAYLSYRRSRKMENL